MSIVFFCQSCGARFEVDARAAGRKGRCKKCGQMMQIPRAEQLASMVAMPALAGAAAGAGGAPAVAAPHRPVAEGVGQSLGNWLRAGVSSVGLAPLTVDRLPASQRKKPPATPLDDAEDSKPYALAFPVDGAQRSGSAGQVAGAVAHVWRREWGVVQHLFRRLNEGAYFVSVPFVLLLLIGVAVRSRQLALFAATFVVLLNVGRIVAGVGNLAVVPLREGLNARKMKKPVRRLIEPVVTIGLVIVAFTFIPWLSAGRPSKGPLAQRLRGSAESLGQEMRGEVRGVVDKAKQVDIEKLGAEAQEKLKTIGTGPGDGAGARAHPGGPSNSAEAAVGGVIKDVGQRLRETLEEAQKQP